MVRKINGRRNSTESTLEKKRSWFSVRKNLCVMISGCPFCHFLTSSFSIDAFLGKNDAGLWWFTPVGSNPKVQMIWLGTATTGVISHWGAASSWKPWNFWKFFPFKFTICLWLQQPFFGLEWSYRLPRDVHIPYNHVPGHLGRLTWVCPRGSLLVKDLHDTWSHWSTIASKNASAKKELTAPFFDVFF